MQLQLPVSEDHEKRFEKFGSYKIVRGNLKQSTAVLLGSLKIFFQQNNVDANRSSLSAID